MHEKQKAKSIIPMIGDPVAQTASPDQWNKQFSIEGTHAICVPFHLNKEGLEAFINMVRHTQNMPGFLSTIPHKSEIPSLCDKKNREVEFLGVANTIRKNSDGTLECAMFDGMGMISAVKSKGCNIEGSSMVIIGCGAAGSAIALEALNQGASNIVLLDRDITHAEIMSAKLKTAFPDREISNTFSTSDNYSAIINASPQGSKERDGMPYQLEEVSAPTIIADAITIPSPTRWITQAQYKGMKIVTGEDMALAQAKLMQNFLGIG